MKEKIFIFLLIFCFVSAVFMPSGIEKTGLIGNAKADYVDTSHDTNQNDIEEDPLVPGWSKDVRLTNTSEPSSNPDAVIDSNGNIHVVWKDDIGDGSGICYSKSIDNGNTWATPTKIDKGDAGSIAVDKDGIIYVAYHKYESPGDYDIWYSKSEDNGLTWFKCKLVDTMCISSVPKIIIKESGIHLLWSDKRDNGEFEVYYKSSNDKGMQWGGDKRVTNTSNESSMPSFVIDSHNILHVVHQEAIESKYELCYINSKDDGDSWSQTKVLAESSPGFREPVISIDSLDVLHLIWTDNRNREKGWEDVCYKKSADGGERWSEDIDISGHLSSNTSMPLGRSFMPTIAIDKFDNIFTVWKCSNFTYENESLVRTSNDLYYRHYNIAKSKWSNITRITYAFDGGRLYPMVIPDSQNLLHMVWFDNRDGNQEIYYKRTLNPVTEPPIVVTQFLNQSTCKPGDYISVSGNAVYNDYIVPNANVIIKILETGDEWTTKTDTKGNYSRTITAPDTPGNYTIRVTVASGNHTGWKLVRLTVEQESTNGGTTNGGTTNGDATNGGQQPDSGGNNQGINFNYAIVIIGVIAVLLLIAGVFLRMKKSSTKVGKTKIEKTELMKTAEKISTITLRCPGCKNTFNVREKEKPFNVKCPHCGKEGTIK